MTMWVNTPAGSNGAAGIQERAQDRIIHFDATRRRKEKLRRRASLETSERPVEAAEPAAVVTNGRGAAATPRNEKESASNSAPHTSAPTPPSPAPAGMSAKELESFLIEFVVEQTGYPPEMVEVDADLEADLGIDSIKKAQLFGELAERFQVQATPGDLSLDDFPTLRHVRDFLARLPRSEKDRALNAQPGGGAASSVELGLRSGPASATHAELRGLTPPARPSGAIRGAIELDRVLIDFVVEQTGYPPEMVELDADLEADLGIDSIKKAQLFGELAERFSIQARPGDLSLDDFPTLRHVRDYLAGLVGTAGEAHGVAQPHESNGSSRSSESGLAFGPAPATQSSLAQSQATGELAGLTPPARPEATMSESELERFLIDFVVEHTGYPAEMVELDADLEADLGIDSIKKAQLFGELAEHFDVRVSTGNLSLDDFPTLRHVLGFLRGVPAKAPAG